MKSKRRKREGRWEKMRKDIARIYIYLTILYCVFFFIIIHIIINLSL